MINLEGNKIYKGLSIDDFFKIVNKLPNKSIVYFHNLSGFDGEFIISYLMKHNYTYVVDKDKLSNDCFTSITTDMTSNYSIDVKMNDKTISFRCSYRLMPISIKKLGELVGMKKLDETHDYDELKNYKTLDDVTNEEIEYLDHDCEILRRCVTYLFDLGITDLTMSTSSFKNWKKTKYMLWKEHLTKSDDKTESIITSSYKGGICMVNPLYSGLKLYNFKSYDYNSMYPSQMLGSMPVGKGFTTKATNENYNCIRRKNEEKGYNKHIITFQVVCAECMDEYMPFIGNNSGFSTCKSYRYDREIQNMTLSLWEDEFNLFCRYYIYDIVILSVTSFKSASGVFDAYIKFWKDMKEHADNDVVRQIAKLMLNSLYGKFGMNVERIAKYPYYVDEKGKVVYSSYESCASTYYYRAIASYITSQARCELIKGIQSIGRKYFIYCDTDSIYCFDECEPNIKIHPHNFGCWKCEGHYTEGMFLKAKVYIKIDNGKKVVRCAGLPNDVACKYLNFETLHDNFEIKGKKKVKKRVNGGVIIDSTDFKIHVGELGV